MAHRLCVFRDPDLAHFTPVLARGQVFLDIHLPSDKRYPPYVLNSPVVFQTGTTTRESTTGSVATSADSPTESPAYYVVWP